MQKKFELYTLKNIENPRNLMTPLELKEYIDFEVKRIYFISDIKLDTGAHCHYEEKELFVMIKGSCIATIDRGNGIEDIKLNGLKNAIYVPSFVWHGFKNFSSDAAILALSSTNYRSDRSDYLEDYSEYLKTRDEKLKNS